MRTYTEVYHSAQHIVSKHWMQLYFDANDEDDDNNDEDTDDDMTVIMPMLTGMSKI